MENQDIKRQMMGLWKKTFHDSDEYIKLIFDNYFDIENIAYYEEKGEIVSALLGIPYIFTKGEIKIPSMYLCGLATKNDFRNKGIMKNLINDINNRAAKRGFIISFLIPASESLVDYYYSRNYTKGIYRLEDRYTSVHDFNNDYFVSLKKEDKRITALKKTKYDLLKCNNLNFSDENEVSKLKKYIENNEQRTHQFFILKHSEKDLDVVIKENKISNGNITICYSQNNEIIGAAFYYHKDNRVVVQRIIIDDVSVYYKLLDHIKNVYPQLSISVYKFPEETERKAIEMKVYGASNPDGGMLDGEYGIVERVYNVNAHAKIYGMLQVLNLSEILKILAVDRKDLKFSILIRDSNKEKGGLFFNVKNGDIEYSSLSEFEFKKQSKIDERTVLSERELLEILFRKKGSNNIIMEAFGIPRIILNMALLLD